jgi:hypothetical protein
VKNAPQVVPADLDVGRGPENLDHRLATVRRRRVIGQKGEE